MQPSREPASAMTRTLRRQDFHGAPATTAKQVLCRAFTEEHVAPCPRSLVSDFFSMNFPRHRDEGVGRAHNSIIATRLRGPPSVAAHSPARVPDLNCFIRAKP